MAEDHGLAVEGLSVLIQRLKHLHDLGQRLDGVAQDEAAREGEVRARDLATLEEGGDHQRVRHLVLEGHALYPAVELLHRDLGPLGDLGLARLLPLWTELVAQGGEVLDGGRRHAPDHLGQAGYARAVGGDRVPLALGAVDDLDAADGVADLVHDLEREPRLGLLGRARSLGRDRDLDLDDHAAPLALQRSHHAAADDVGQAALELRVRGPLRSGRDRRAIERDHLPPAGRARDPAIEVGHDDARRHDRLGVLGAQVLAPDEDEVPQKVGQACERPRDVQAQQRYTPTLRDAAPRLGDPVRATSARRRRDRSA